MILRPQLEHTDEQPILDYYLAHYDEVHILTCNKCGTDLGLEIKGQVSGLTMNKNGFSVLPIGTALLSSRVRTDGSMGYQCGAMVDNPEFPKAVAAIEKVNKDQFLAYDRTYKTTVKSLKKGVTKPEYLPPAAVTVDVPRQVMCGNDTRGTELEEQLSPDGTFLPHEVDAIERKQVEIGWKPKIKRQGNKEIHETFTRERIK